METKIDFRKAIEFLRNNPSQCAKMGSMSRQLVENRFRTENMINQIISAAHYARKVRKKHI